MDFSTINYLAVFVAGLAAFGLGSAWYSPLLFGKAWQNDLGFTDQYLQQGNMGKIFGTSFVLMLVMSFGMAIFIQGHNTGEINWLSGLTHGLYVGVFFVATSMGINILYQRKPFRLWAIDALYQVIFLAMMGSILGAWK